MNVIKQDEVSDGDQHQIQHHHIKDTATIFDTCVPDNPFVTICNEDGHQPKSRIQQYTFPVMIVIEVGNAKVKAEEVGQYGTKSNKKKVNKNNDPSGKNSKVFDQLNYQPIFVLTSPSVFSSPAALLPPIEFLFPLWVHRGLEEGLADHNQLLAIQLLSQE